LSVSRKRKPSKQVAPVGENRLAQTLAHESQIDSALARITDAWPALPEPIRRAMMALVETR
jgi:hypothetical protein